MFHLHQNLDYYLYPYQDDLRAKLTDFVDYYNNQRYHEALGNVTPAGGRAEVWMGQFYRHFRGYGFLRYPNKSRFLGASMNVLVIENPLKLIYRSSVTFG